MGFLSLLPIIMGLTVGMVLDKVYHITNPPLYYLLGSSSMFGYIWMS